MFLYSASLISTCAGTRGTASEQGKSRRRLSSSVVVEHSRTAQRRPERGRRGVPLDANYGRGGR